MGLEQTADSANVETSRLCIQPQGVLRYRSNRGEEYDSTQVDIQVV